MIGKVKLAVMGDSIVKLANYYANGFESMTIRSGIEMIKEFDESVLTFEFNIRFARKWRLTIENYLPLKANIIE